MGSNVHFKFMLNTTAKEIPEDLGCEDSCTLPRYSDGREFMRAVWDVENVWGGDCGCRNKDNDDYYCGGIPYVRPKDFVSLREKTKNLQPIWQKVIDYLESEPSAYIEYD